MRQGGPELTEKLLKLCVEKKEVRGSSGTIYYDNGKVSFVAHGR